MDLKLIRNLLRLMERGEVTELEIQDDAAGLKVHLKRGNDQAVAPSPPVVNLMPGAAPVSAPAAAAAPALVQEPPLAVGADLEEIKSPMVGTYYSAASPDSDVFVRVGDTLGEDTTVCIIEAMKVMNEIKAECRGEIVEILVENGDAVEFGQPLFLVKTR